MYYPNPEPLNNIAAQVTHHMKMNLVPENVQLIQTAPGQAFFAQVYIAALVGVSSWNACNNQRACRIYQTSTKRK